jgi:RNA polymerase sigma-70 factor (ECF subfamily)
MYDQDRRLIRQLLGGEEAAFNEFFAVYFDRLFRFASLRLADEDAARDIVQETMCRALRNLAKFRGEAALFTWLCQICRSQLAEYAERRGRQRRIVVAIDDDPALQAVLESAVAPDANPEEQLQQGQLLGLVQRVLDQLPPRYGDALEWKYVEGVSVEVIAARLDVPHVAAQSLLQRARSAFRTVFAEVAGTAHAFTPSHRGTPRQPVHELS